jgi:hypothetical protein
VVELPKDFYWQRQPNPPGLSVKEHDMKRTSIPLVAAMMAITIGLFAATTASAQGVYVMKYRGYGPVVAPVYPYGYIAPYYGYPYNPRKAYRQGLRYGYPPLFQAWPLPPAPTYAYPYYGAMPYYGPVGPRDYMYQPQESRPLPQPPRPQLQEPLPEPLPAPEPALPPEPIPAPAGG